MKVIRPGTYVPGSLQIAVDTASPSAPTGGENYLESLEDFASNVSANAPAVEVVNTDPNDTVDKPGDNNKEASMDDMTTMIGIAAGVAVLSLGAWYMSKKTKPSGSAWNILSISSSVR